MSGRGKRAGGSSNAAGSEAPSSSKQRKSDPGNWCVDCWAVPKDACRGVHRLLDREAAEKEEQAKIKTAKADIAAATEVVARKIPAAMSTSHDRSNDGRPSDDEKYSKKTNAGTQSAKGPRYEHALHCQVALKSLNNEISGAQTYEETNMGCWDDLCFKSDARESHERKQLILLQAKHANPKDPDSLPEITASLLAAPKGATRDDFSLPTYFMSFLEAKRRATEIGWKINQLVLFTNKGMSETLQKNQLVEVAKGDLEEPFEQLFNFSFEGQRFFRFKDKSEPADFFLRVAKNKKEQRNIAYRDELVKWGEEQKQSGGLDGLKEEFLDILIFAVNQPNVDELEKILDDEFSKLLICQKLSNNEKDTIFRDFKKDVKFWMDEGDKNVSAWTSTRTDTCLRKAIAELNRLKVKGLSDKNLQHLNNGVNIQVNEPQSLFPSSAQHFVYHTQQLSTQARLAIHSMGPQVEYKLLKDEDLTEDLYECLIASDVTLILLHEAKSRRTVDDVLKKIARHDSLRKLVLTTQHVDSCLDEVRPEDLSEQTLDKILERNVTFQGKRIMMRDVVDGHHSLRSILNPQLIEDLSLGSEVILGKEVSSAPEFYIPRHLSVVSDTASKSSHHVRRTEETTCFEEDQIVMEAVTQNRHVIVSAPPGFGKSSLAASLCMKTKQQQPAWWVGHCDLRKKMTALGKFKADRKSQQAQSTPSSLTKLEWQLMWDLFDVRGDEKRLLEDRFKRNAGVNVVLFIDSYDEIDHFHGPVFMAFLKSLKEIKSVHLFVMTREHSLERVQSTLEENMAFKLEALREQDQVTLLSNLLNKNAKGRVSDEEVLDLMSRMPYQLCDNPLHLSMISETYGIPAVFTEGYNISMYNLYEWIVEKKFDLYWGENRFEPRANAEKNTLKIVNCLKQLAVTYLFGDKWKSGETQLQQLEWVLQCNVGFVSTDEQGNLSFDHESFAEYFLSLYVHDLLQEPPESNSDSQIINNVLLEKRFAPVRLFLDGKLMTDPISQNSEALYQTLPDKENFLLLPAVECLPALACFLWQFRSLISDEKQHDAFVEAAGTNCKSFVEHAIQDGLDVNQPRLDGYRALHAAANCWKVRIGRGAGESLLSLVQVLLDAGAEVNSVTSRGNTALHLACSKGHHDVVTLLIDKGCDVKATTKHGETALHLACQMGFVDVVKVLLEKGCDVNASSEGKNALHFACERGDLALVKVLTEKGCDVNATTEDGETALHLACQWGHVDVVKVLIGKGCDVKATTKHGETALHLACQRGHVDVVKVLIGKGCDVKATTKHGETALHVACYWGHVDAVKVLIGKGCDVKATTKHGETALHLACERGFANVVKVLIGKGCDVNATTKDGKNALHVACYWGLVDAVKVLIGKGCDVNATTKDGETPLHFACQSLNADLSTWLLEKGCDVNATTNNGENALHFACLLRNLAVVKVLLEKGCDVNASIEGKNALHFACEGGDQALVKVLTEKGCDVNATTEDGETALHLACQWGHVDVVKVLIGKGCDVKATTKHGETALHLACQRGHVDVVKVLIGKGCDVKATTKHGETALHLACQRGYANVVKVLIGKGCDVNATTKDGKNALHVACYWGRVDAVKVLIGKGCDVNATTKDGETPLHFACQSLNADLLTWLLEKGCDVNATTNNGKNALHFACLRGNLDVVKVLLEKGCDVNATTKDGETPLHFACQSMNADLFTWLLEKGCDVNATTNNGKNALHFACLRGNFDVVKVLLEKGFDVNATTEYGETALHFAKRMGNPFVIALLEGYGTR